MKIVHVPRRFVQSDWGGTETVILQISKSMLRNGHDVEVLCANALSQQNQDCIDGIRVRRFPYFYPYWGLDRGAKDLLDRKGGNIFSFSLMKALAHSENLDVIHLHTGKRIGGIVRHIARKRKLPYVVSLHGGVLDVPDQEKESWTAPANGSFEWGKALGWWVGARRVLDDSAAILCVGAEEQARMQRLYPEKRVLHLPNGVDIARFSHGSGERFRQLHGIHPQAPVLLTVGRIDPQKNQLAVVHALPKLLEKHPALQFVMVGHVTNEAYHRQLHGDIESLGLGRHAKIIAGLDPSGQDLVDAYHAADIFLLPSVHEPFGIVILEAWAASRPVIASRVGGIPSFVGDGKNGLLFDPASDLELRDAVDRLLRDRRRANELAQTGRGKAGENYGWDTVTNRLLGIYQDVIRENSFRQ